MDKYLFTVDNRKSIVNKYFRPFTTPPNAKPEKWIIGKCTLCSKNYAHCSFAHIHGKNPPKIKLKNSWNWRVILFRYMPATVSHILNENLIHLPETDMLKVALKNAKPNKWIIGIKCISISLQRMLKKITSIVRSTSNLVKLKKKISLFKTLQRALLNGV